MQENNNTPYLTILARGREESDDKKKMKQNQKLHWENQTELNRLEERETRRKATSEMTYKTKEN